MRDRKSVLMVIYDLPTLTPQQRRDAQKFRKKLIARGFLPLQESVYVKLLRNASGADGEVTAMQKLAPPEGVVQVIPMSLQVFQNMRTLTGDGFNMKVFADDLVFF